VTVRLTPETHARLAAEASRLGLSRAGYLHHLVENKRVTVLANTDPDALPIALINEMKRLGNNLNQIAHAANANLPPNQTQLAAALRDLLRLIAKDELLARRIEAIRTRDAANDSPPSPSGPELQGRISLHFARSRQRHG